ncbi:hypothetical protein U3A55_12100 [Salarchaeum sp. III]
MSTSTDTNGLSDEQQAAFERLRDHYDGDILGDVCAQVLESSEAANS